MRETIKIYQPIWQTVFEIYQPKHNSTSQQNLNESYRRVTWGKIPQFKNKYSKFAQLLTNLKKFIFKFLAIALIISKVLSPFKILTTRLESLMTSKVRRVARILKWGDNIGQLQTNGRESAKICEIGLK